MRVSSSSMALASRLRRSAGALFHLNLSRSHPRIFRRSFSSSHSQLDLQNVGFIGLGNMGSRMANNLLKAGYNLTIHDVNYEVMDKISAMGALAKETPYEVAEASDVVVTMLPSAAHVMEVYNGANGILSGQKVLRPWLLIDSSTIDPHTSRKLASAVSDCNLKSNRGTCPSKKKKLAEVLRTILQSEDGESSNDLQLHYNCSPFMNVSNADNWQKPVMLDAPVSGGILAAEAGTLTFMVGGPEDAFLAAKSLFLSMGKSTIFCGGPGNGSAAKICNNLAMAVSMLGVSEALALGQSLGLPATTLTKVFNSSSARCWSSDTYNPVPGVMEGVPASKNYRGGFTSKLMAKDLNLAAASAKEVNLRSPLTSLAQQIYVETCNNGDEFKDFSCVFRHFYSGKDEFS